MKAIITLIFFIFIFSCNTHIKENKVLKNSKSDSLNLVINKMITDLDKKFNKTDSLIIELRKIKNK